MPYIKKEDRRQVSRLGNSTQRGAATAGELNFVITQLLLQYLTDNGKSYQKLNDIIGVLECAKLELYRRIVAPYENTKIEENGDVF